ncbi:hypothetical protein TCAL_01553 [Tigriopus californicus]|uniref:WASH complex subunit strumpellin n=1 Tax=Tigriopus californicus TaxID=6832 RepID=A0A553P7A9_TIGCA|nr:WASH complex subunit 5-like [Tigriopus californicus]TRY73510.1 hypothetical protein TCAL_01553 [Tigriopus californicus]
MGLSSGMDFLADNNACGRILLRLVSRAHSTLAELLRLKEAAPTLYRNPTKAEQAKYGELIAWDFHYFKSSEVLEHRISQNESLQLLDMDLKETYGDLLARFYRLFQSIQRYTVDLKQFLEDLEDGAYIQQSVETVFQDPDGKQLLCESLYVLGAMLLLVDQHLEGHFRERILVAHYRYSGQDQGQPSHVDEICQLLRSTGYSIHGKRPAHYPETLFSRVALPTQFVQMVLGRLRSDDLYHQFQSYPLPEHRSAALAEQAAMLYVCLYFEGGGTAAVLKTESAAMREIVDKFFADNWIITYYMGHEVNLVEAWEPYKAAKAALANTLQPSKVKELSLKSTVQIQKVMGVLRGYLKEGCLTEDNVLEQIPKILNLIRESNVALKWRMLHTLELSQYEQQIKKCRQLRDQVLSESKHEPFQVFQLLLYVAEFEQKFKDIYRKIWNSRESIWNTLKTEVNERLSDLALIYGGDQSTVSRRMIQKNEKLQKWFLEQQAQVQSLALEQPLTSGRLAVQLAEAINEAMELEQLASSLQVKQSLMEIKTRLHRLIRIAGIKEDVMIVTQIVGDISYGWRIVEQFTPFMQDGVKKDPGLVKRLRATFLKLASALEGPVLRISQARSGDLLSVSQYYSSELVSYVRRVLQIIPESMFHLLDQIIRLQTHEIKEVPTRLDKNKIKEFAQLAQRFQVAELTHSISVFTEGILAMKSTLVGVIKVDPKQLLEDGIRKEIVRQVSKTLHQTLMFNPKAKTCELTVKLKALKTSMSGFRRSFEYIQDYVRISGLKIWQEELSRIILFHVEQETNVFLTQKVLPGNSVYQNKSIPIPTPPPTTNPDCQTFMGRLANEIILLTNPRTTVYSNALCSWYDLKTKDEVCSMGLFSLLEEAVGTIGLAGLDRLLGLKIVTCLQNMIRYTEKTVFRDKSLIEMLENLGNSLNPTENVVAQPMKFYGYFLGRTYSLLGPVVDALLTLGQLQLLRQKIAYQLSLSSHFDSKILFSSLQALNQSLVSNMKVKCDREGFTKTKALESPLLYELNSFLNWSGLHDPNGQIYLTTKAAPKMSELAALVFLTGLGRSKFCPNTGHLIPKKLGDPLDGHMFVLGAQCWLQQFSDSVGTLTMAYLAQYARSFADVQSRANETLGPEVTTTILFLERLAAVRSQVRSAVNENLPEPLIHMIPKN